MWISTQFYQYHQPESYAGVLVGWQGTRVKGHNELKVKRRVKTLCFKFPKLLFQPQSFCPLMPKMVKVKKGQVRSEQDQGVRYYVEPQYHLAALN